MVSHDDRLNVMGPTTRATDDRPGPIGPWDIHGNTQGMDFRAGEPPPAYLKGYLGQGGITGHGGGSPTASHNPGAPQRTAVVADALDPEMDDEGHG